MLPKCFQNGPKWSPDGLWSPVWARERSEDASGQQNPGHRTAKPRPFGTQKSTQKPSKIDLESDFKTNSLSRPIWDRFSIDFRAVGSKFLIQIGSLYLQSERDIRQNRTL